MGSGQDSSPTNTSSATFAPEISNLNFRIQFDALVLEPLDIGSRLSLEFVVHCGVMLSWIPPPSELRKFE